MMFGVYLLLNLVVLSWVARASPASGWRLTMMLFMLGWVVGSGNSLIEAVFFQVLTLDAALAAAFFAAIIFAILSPIAVPSRAVGTKEPFRANQPVSRRWH